MRIQSPFPYRALRPIGIVIFVLFMAQIYSVNHLYAVEIVATTPNERDIYSNTVTGQDGSRINYYATPNQKSFSNVVSNEPLPINSQSMLVTDPFQQNALSVHDLKRTDHNAIQSAMATSAPSSQFSLVETWRQGLLGTGIGLSGITVRNIDNEPQAEIVAAGGYNFDRNYFWFVLSYDPATKNYQQKWMSVNYSVNINRLLVADVDGDGSEKIYIGLSNGVVEVFNASTYKIEQSFTNLLGSLEDMELGDLDGDGQLELVMISARGIAVHDARTLSEKWRTSLYGASELEIGNVDDDAALEIVTTSRVVDSGTKTAQWSYAAGFGARIKLTDVDADGTDEIIGAASWYDITVFDALSKNKLWGIKTQQDIFALEVADVNQDNIPDILYGDGQWGNIHAIDRQTGQEMFRVNNPLHSVTRIAVGDSDGDGLMELLWGAGWTSTGSDRLYIADLQSRSIEWQSTDISNPISLVRMGDVDNDGADELVVASYKSDSGYYGGIIFIYDAATHQLEAQSAPVMGSRGWGGIQALELGDVDNDGVLEIVIATSDLNDGIVQVYDGITRDLQWQSPKLRDVVYTALHVADLEGDGSTEVIAGGGSGTQVVIFNGNNGMEKWRTADDGSLDKVADVDVADLDGDHKMEIVFAKGWNEVFVYSSTSQTLTWRIPVTSTNSIRIADVDQNGKNDLILGSYWGQIRAFDGQTHQLLWEKTISTKPINSLQVTDLNGDGLKELVVTDESYIYVIALPTLQIGWQSEYLGGALARRNNLAVKDIDNDGKPEILVGTYTLVYQFKSLPTASINIVLDVIPEARTDFAFQGNLGQFKLDDAKPDDGDAYTSFMKFSAVTGEYKISQANASGYVLTNVDCSGIENPIVDLSQNEVTIPVQSSETITCTFTNQKSATLVVYSFNDFNGNGLRSTDEPFLSGWTVRLSDTAKIFTPQVTSNTGSTIFRSIYPGTVRLCEDLQPGWHSTFPGVVQPENQPCIDLTLLPGRSMTVRLGNQLEANPNVSREGELPAIEDMGEVDPETLNETDNQPSLFLPLVVR